MGDLITTTIVIVTTITTVSIAADMQKACEDVLLHLLRLHDM